MNLTVNDKQYRIEFRYITKLGKLAQLHRGPIKAITTCVVIEIGGSFIAIDNTLCLDSDNFSRREGRLRSLNKLLDHCGLLRAVKPDFFNEYIKLDPGPPPQPPRPPKPRLSAERIAELKAAGQVNKIERRLKRKAARFTSRYGREIELAQLLTSQIEAAADRLGKSAND